MLLHLGNDLLQVVRMRPLANIQLPLVACRCLRS